MSGQSTPADVSLFQWVWRTYVRQALVPLLLVELVLLGVYLVTHEWSRRENTAALREVVAAEIDRLAARQSTVIDQQLMQVSVLTDALRRQAVRAMSSPPARREDPKRYAVSSGGALYAVNDGGVGVLYSSLVKRGPAELERLARSASLDPALIDVKESSPLIVQTYFNTYDSINRIWPWMDASTQYPQDMDIPKYNFYYEADAVHNPARKVVWTDAYLDPAGQGWMVSAIAPVYTGDFLEGVVGLDITLDRVVSTVLDTDLPWDGFGLLVAEDGTILALPPAAESVFALRALDKGKYSDVREDTLKPDAFNLFRSAALQPLGKLIGTRSEGRGELRLNGNHLAAWSRLAGRASGSA